MSIIQYTTASRYVEPPEGFFLFAFDWFYELFILQNNKSIWALEKKNAFFKQWRHINGGTNSTFEKLRVTFLKIMVKAGDLKLYTVFQESRHSLSFVCARFSQMQCSIRKWVHISEHRGSPIFYVVVAQTIPKHGCNV